LFSLAAPGRCLSRVGDQYGTLTYRCQARTRQNDV
jgi:hypothetical protein